MRLPLEFSRRLFEITHVGTPVILAGSHLDPATITHPGLVLSEAARDVFDREVAKLDAKSHPKDWPQAAASATQNAIVSVVVTGRDRRIAIIENGKPTLESDVTIVSPDQPLGSHVYILRGAAGDGAHLSWDTIAHSSDPRDQVVAIGALHRISTPSEINAAIHDRWHPGMMLVLTDQPAHPDTRSGSDFVVMTDDAAT